MHNLDLSNAKRDLGCVLQVTNQYKRRVLRRQSYQETSSSDKMQHVHCLQSEVARLTQAHADMECALHLDSVCIATRLRGLCNTYQDFIPTQAVRAVATEIINHAPQYTRKAGLKRARDECIVWAEGKRQAV